MWKRLFIVAICVYNNTGAITFKARLNRTIWILYFRVVASIRWLWWAKPKWWNETGPPTAIGGRLCLDLIRCNVTITAASTWIGVSDCCRTIPCDRITECIQNECDIITPCHTIVPIFITFIKCISECAPFEAAQCINWLHMLGWILMINDLDS